MGALTHQNLSLLAGIAVVLPFISFLGILLFPGKNGRGGVFSIFNISVSLILSTIIFFQVWNKTVVHEQIQWFTIGHSHFKIGILLNNLSAIMLLLVSAIGVLVHIYSTQYMKGDSYLYRYWAYLGLFCFSMLGLIIADNLLLIYIFWELVGFSSYLLIGFWFTRDAAVRANKKAFIMNRLGDLGFLTGIMIVFSQFETLDLIALFGKEGLVSSAVLQNGLWVSGAHQMPAVWLTLAGLAFFFGASAKSAQFPLHTWLPDAMEGPTSVSSLIHAATMVAAGVFLLGRIYPIFDSTVLIVIASIGAFTAFMAATIALTQNDIKRILAFSTISQLGFMMIAMGIGAYAAGFFHLVTHAFFKCLLFLAAGSVIHELHHLKDKSQLSFDHQDIRNMGGIRKQMPVTFITMLLASLALAGIPLTSGYLSKDAILIQAFEWSDVQSGWLKWIPYTAVITSWLTAFYIFRLIFKVFFGEFRIEKQLNIKVALHEAPAAMKYVLMVLAVFCLFPVFSFNPVSYDSSWIIEGLGFEKKTGEMSNYHLIIPVTVSIFSVVLILMAFNWYAKRNQAPAFSEVLSRFSQNQWYFDSIYKSVFVNGITSLSVLAYKLDKRVVDGIVNLTATIGIVFSSVVHLIDKYVIDGLVNAVASMAKTIGNFARHFQTGRLQHYLLTMIIMVLTFFMIRYFSQAI